MEQCKIGTGPKAFPGTSVRKEGKTTLAGGLAFGQSHDERGYEIFAGIGQKTHYSKVRSVPQCGFGGYSSRSAPIYKKLDANW